MLPLLLVIDDDESLLELYKLLFEDEGYSVHLSNIPYESARQVEQVHPDLILLDVKFGVSNEGFHLLHKLKLYAPTKTTPTILCTAAISEVMKQEALLRANGVPVMYKPFEVEELLGEIRSTLALRSFERAFHC